MENLSVIVLAATTAQFIFYWDKKVMSFYFLTDQLTTTLLERGQYTFR